MDLSLAFYFVPLIYISVFVPVPYCLDDCSFVVEPEVRQVGNQTSSFSIEYQVLFSTWNGFTQSESRWSFFPSDLQLRGLSEQPWRNCRGHSGRRDCSLGDFWGHPFGFGVGLWDHTAWIQHPASTQLALGLGQALSLGNSIPVSHLWST